MSDTTRNIGLDVFNSLEMEMTGKKHLFVIGIDNYHPDSGFPGLKHPVQDAKKLVDVLVNQFGFENEVTEVFNEQCTELKIREAINDVKEKLGKEDHLVVFFAGHGAVDDKKGYWLVYNEKKKVNLHVPVSDIIERLMGCCRQVLMIVDCCFAGAATEAAYRQSLSAHFEDKKSQFAVITSGNIYQPVPDHSDFMQSVFTLLSGRSFTNLHSFIGGIKTMLNGNAKTTVTDYLGVNQHDLPYLFKHINESWTELEKYFLEMNYEKQSQGIKGLRIFNLLYLRGTKLCGHHLFTHRYLKENGITQFDLFNYKLNFIRIGGELKGTQYNIWEEIVREFNWKNTNYQQVIENILETIKAKPWILILKIDNNCDNKTLQATLFDFWEKLTEYLSAAQYNPLKFHNKIHFLIWDRRGDSKDVIEEKWKSTYDQRLARLFHLPPIEKLNEQPDLWNWYNNALDTSTFLKEEAIFNEMDLKQVKTPETIANVICNISGLCGQVQLHDKLFNQQILWMQ